ncbi:hypothetical protein A2U01_0112289, partial [Trifolium medium]|nr:hypothetical protein [Trifolium medium]
MNATMGMARPSYGSCTGDGT